MSEDKKTIDITDERWGGQVPWFYRDHGFSYQGDFDTFFSRLSVRIKQLLNYDETGLKNKSHFMSKLESKSFQKFISKENHRSIPGWFGDYFTNSCVVKRPSPYGNTRLTSTEEDRVGVLEVMLKLLPKGDGLSELVRDIRSYLVESQIMLDIDVETLEIKILEEPLLQKEVIDKLLPRLSVRFPERADGLVKCYHGLLEGKDFDSIFIDAVKILEDIARGLVGDSKFEFKRGCLKDYFSGLHPTIHESMLKLAAHRGDRGAHGKDAPKPHEMRYLLFTVCNIALLMLDYYPEEKS